MIAQPNGYLWTNNRSARQELSIAEKKNELMKCAASAQYFIHTYCRVQDAAARAWVPFHLWPGQIDTLNTLLRSKKVVILKARQLGMSWLVLGYALWLALFRPAASELLFSRRDDEAVHLLDDRLKGMYRQLPEWMQARGIVESNSHEWSLSNGSTVRAFPTSGGDTYTGTLAIVDEADLIDDLQTLMDSVAPTVEMGGQLILLSRPNKARPASYFKNVYRAARKGENDWTPVFLPWHVHPGRSQAWYDRQQRDSLYNTGSLDSVWEQYPATEAEALAARTLDKRFSPAWINQCYVEQQPIAPGDLPHDAPSIQGLRLYALPEPGARYALGGDPAEGNPTSDDSALHVLHADTLEEVAHLAGKFEPSTFADHINTIGTYFNNAAVMVERNNHGHAVLLSLREHSRLTRLRGHDRKVGWMSNALGKARLYDMAASIFRDGSAIIHTFATFDQLLSIEGSTLLAPNGQHDDLADSYALAIAAAHAAAVKTNGEAADLGWW